MIKTIKERVDFQHGFIPGEYEGDLNCVRCGHKWFGRSPYKQRGTICPNCHHNAGFFVDEWDVEKLGLWYEQDKKESTALIKYEPKPLFGVPSALDESLAPLSWQERLNLYAEQKRQELDDALEQGRVSDPITGAIFTMATLKAIAISLAVSAASMLLTSALTPRRKITEERGRRSGELLINSELGVLLPEVYFGDPGDGYGGSWVSGIVGWTSGLRKHETVTSTPTGGGKGFGGATPTTEVREITYDLDWLIIWANKGPYRVLRSKANSDIVFDLYGPVAGYEAETVASLTAPYLVVAYEHASNGYEVTLQAGTPGGAAQFNNVKSNGAATRQVSIYYRTSSNTVPIEYTVNGGTPVAVTLPATNETYLTYTFAAALNDGSSNVIKIQNKSPTFNLGLDKIWCFPGHATATQATGLFKAGVGGDSAYDPSAPPDPNTAYTKPTERFQAVIDPGGDDGGGGGGGGSINVGGGAGFQIYPGTLTQLPDPTYEAAIDAQYGAGSTPAFRGRCYEVDANFYLTRWGGMVPNRIALVEHNVIRNLAQMCAFMCSRVGLTSTDTDFSALESILPRGLRIMGRKFEAREPMESAEIPFDVYYCEIDGKLTGKKKAGYTIVATLTDEDFGWTDEEESTDGPFQILDPVEPDESDLPRRVDVKYVDLDRDGEPGLQGYSRQVTVGEESVTLDLNWTMTREEAQALAQKEVYRRYVEKPCKYTLSWEHLWITPGMVFQADLSDGFSYVILHAKDSGGIGPRECEGIILDEPVFTQSAVTDPYAYEQPVVPVPAMTVVTFIDTPVLRDIDYTKNLGGGFYVAACQRTGTAQAWRGAGLFQEIDGEWEKVDEFRAPCIMGTAVTALPDTANFTTEINSYTLDVDLYGADATLASVTATQASNGTANLFVIGNEAIGVKTASRRPLIEGPNRWRLTGFYRGRRGTSNQSATHLSGERVVLINASVKFVMADYTEVGATKKFKAITANQSFDDAAEVEFTFTGRGMDYMTPAPTFSTTPFVIPFNGTSLLHKVIIPPTARGWKELQISYVNDPNTFTDDLNKIARVKADNYPDSKLSTDPRSATIYYRLLGAWGNASSIVSASYNVTAPSAPTVSPPVLDRTNFVFTITPSDVGYNTNWIKQTHVEASTSSDFSANLKTFTYARYTKTVRLSANLYRPKVNYFVRAYFTDAFGDGAKGA